MNDFTKSRVTNFLDDLVDQAENASMNCTSSAEDERLFEEEAPRAFSSDDLCQLTNDLAKGKLGKCCSYLIRLALRSYARRFACKESAPKKLFEEKYLKRCKRFEKIVARKAYCGLGM